MKQAFIGSVLLALSQGAAAQTGREPAPIIDMHVHAYETDERWKFHVPNPATGMPLLETTEADHMRATFAALKRYNIVKAVVNNDSGGNLAVARRWQAAWPERVIVGAGFDSASNAPDLAALRAAVQRHEVGVLGEIGAQYEGLTLADPQFEPYLALAEELDLPVGVHTGLGPPTAPYEGSQRFRTRFGNPQLIEDVLIRHPKLRLYLMHAGWPYLAETKAILTVYPQVYADLAVIDWIIPREEFHEYLRALMRAGFGKQLMFGSDQMVWTDAIGRAIEGIESADFLSPIQKRDIFYNNAARFLRIESSTDAKSK